MRLKSQILLVCLCAIAPVTAAARILPPACGDDKIKFEVKVEKGSLDLPPLAPGKARIVFIETLTKHGVIGRAATTRYGVDGTWMGANKGDSYFYVDVDPGHHEVCANWQAVNTTGNSVGVAQVNAKAGGIYYFEAAILDVAESPGPGAVYTNVQFRFVPLSPQTGQTRLREVGMSTFKPK